MLSRGLAGLQLGVLSRSAALLGAALEDSFTDELVAAFTPTSMPRTACSATPWFPHTATFMFPPRGRSDLSGVAGPFPRAGLHPTALPQGLVPKVGARDAAVHDMTTMAISIGMDASSSP